MLWNVFKHEQVKNVTQPNIMNQYHKSPPIPKSSPSGIRLSLCWPDPRVGFACLLRHTCLSLCISLCVWWLSRMPFLSEWLLFPHFSVMMQESKHIYSFWTDEKGLVWKGGMNNSKKRWLETEVIWRGIKKMKERKHRNISEVGILVRWLYFNQ